jgi:hypothetical protein
MPAQVMVASGPTTSRSATDYVAELVKLCDVSPALSFQPAASVDMPSGQKGREIRYEMRTPGGLMHCQMRVVIQDKTLHAAVLLFNDADGSSCRTGELTLHRWDPPTLLRWDEGTPAALASP